MIKVEEVEKIIKKLEEDTKKVLDEMKDKPEDSRELFFKGLKTSLDHIFLKTATPLYCMIENHSISVSHIWFQEGVESGELVVADKTKKSQEKLIEDPRSIDDFSYNLAILRKACSQLKEAMNHMHNGPIGLLDKEYFEIRKNYSQFLSRVDNFVSYAILLKKIGEEKSEDKFLKSLVTTLETMKSLLEEASKYIEGAWGKYGKDPQNSFNLARGFFDEVAEALIKTARDVSVEEKKVAKGLNNKSKKEVQEVPENKVSQPTVSLFERKRLELISEVNLMYDEFVNGTLIDLNKQAPYSVRKEYFEIVDLFELFVKKYKMPLSDSTDFNKADKAKRQLEILNEKVSELSQNATTTNIYMMKE